ncbi:MAG: hypothetical protein SGILL_001884, partial [Bacillariaceae sp.]
RKRKLAEKEEERKRKAEQEKKWKRMSAAEKKEERKRKSAEKEEEKRKKEARQFPCVISKPLETDVVMKLGCTDPYILQVLDFGGDMIWGVLKDDDGSFLNPESAQAYPHRLEITDLTHGKGIVYAVAHDDWITEDNENGLDKGGQTGNPKCRFGPKSTYATHGHAGKKDLAIYQVVNFDLLSFATDRTTLCVVWHAWKDVLAMKQIPYPYKNVIHRLAKREGYRAGADKVFARSLVENGMFRQFPNVTSGNTNEFGMFDQRVWDKWHALAATIKEKLLVIYKALMGGMDSETLALEDILVVVSSWNTGHAEAGGRSAKCTLTNLIAGMDLDYRETNTLPEPAIPGATTHAEQFSTAFSKPARERGGAQLKKDVMDLQPGQILKLDANNLCMGGRGKVDKFLVDEAGYEPELRVFSGHLRIYTHKKKKTMVIVNMPWCYALDSFNNPEDWEGKILRMICAEGMYQFMCEITPGRVYEPKRCPLLAMYNFLFVAIGLHLGLRLGVRFAVDVLTDDRINAITESNCPLRPRGQLYPYSENNRNRVRAGLPSTFEGKKTDYAMNICGSFMGSIDCPEDLEGLRIQLERLFKRNSDDWEEDVDPARKVAACYRALISKLLRVDPELAVALDPES